MTLAELLVASAVMVLIALSVAALAHSVHTGADYSLGRGMATQHARVALERIERAVEQAHSTESDPGIAVLADVVGTARFPETLVVWRSDANRDNLVQVQELTIFAPDVTAPNRLIELTAPGDTRTVSLANTAALKTVVDGLRADGSRQRVVLTDQLRTAAIPDEFFKLRGAIVFGGEWRPSAADVAAYRGGTTAWTDLPWPQGFAGGKIGLQQGWVRIEFHLVPADNAAAAESTDVALPFFGSAAFHTEINK